MHYAKRLAALLLAAILVFSLLPVSAMATEEDGTGEHVQCTKSAGCTITDGHDGNCSDFVKCTKSEGCTYAEGHDGNCSDYVAPETCAHGIAKTETCADCAAPEVCEHNVAKTETCADCAAAAQAAAESAARIKAVQDLIDALPTTVTNEDEAAAMEAAFTAVDEAKAALVGDEVDRLNLTKWEAAMSAYNTYKGNPGASIPDTGIETGTTSFTANLGRAYVSHNGEKLRIWGEFSGVTGGVRSCEIKILDTNGNLFTTLTLAGDYTSHTGLSWYLALTGTPSNSWTSTWNSTQLSPNVIPTTASFTINGNECGSITIEHNCPDAEVTGTKKPWTEWFVAKAGGVYYTSLAEAIEKAGGAKITLLADVTENITTGTKFDLNLGDKTVNGYFFLTGKATIGNGTIDSTVSAAQGKAGIESSTGAIVEVGDLTIASKRHAIRVDGGQLIVHNGTYTTIGKAGEADTCHAINAGGGEYNSAKVTIYGGTFNGLGANASVETADSGCAITAQTGATVTIHDGTFNGRYRETVGNNYGGTYTLYGGTYDQDPRVTGVTLGDKKAVKKIKKISGTEYQVVDGTVKNETSGKYYATIQDAVNDAAADNKIVLLDNITETGVKVPVGKDVVIDLSDKTVTGDFVVYGDAVIQNGIINSTVSGKSGIETNNEADRTLNPTLTAEDLTIVSGRHAIRVDGGTVIINSGSYTAADAASNHAVNISDGGNVTIKDGTFTGNNQSGTGAVALRNASSLTIEDGTFIGGSTGSLTVWGDGGTATVKNGTFDSVYADIAITIEDGTFGTINKMVNRGISGGTFGTDPSAHVISTKAAMLEDGKYTIVDAEAQIGEQGYYPLEAAVVAAADGQTVKLLKDRTGAAMDLNDSTAARTITLDLNGNNLDGEMIVSNEASTVTITDSADGSSATVSVKMKSALTKEGHTIGWKNTTDNTVAATVAAAGTYSIGWIPNKYEIIFYGNGATGGSMANLTEVLFTQEVTLTNGFTKTGYHFVKWTMEQGGGGNSYLETATPSGLASENGATVELYAQWELNKYNIVFDGNGGSAVINNSTVTQVTDEVSYGTTVKLPGNYFTNGEKKFIGWNTRQDGNGTNYAVGAEVSNLTDVNGASYTLYANWADKDAPKFTITKDEFTYNGMAQGIQYSIDVPAKVTLRYYSNNATVRVTTPVAPINAGTYDVVVEIEATSTTSAVTYYYPNGLTINKAPLTATYVGETIYAGTAPALKITYSGFQGSDTPSNIPGFARPTFKTAIPSTIGKHYLELDGGDPGSNYYFIYRNDFLTIKEKVIYVYNEDKLLQTGEAAWAIPVLAFCGLSIMAAGAWITLKKKSYGR